MTLQPVPTPRALLQARWDAREPRPEDVARIRALEGELRSREAALATAEDRMAALRGEMLLREDNYNKHFANGGAGQRVLDVAAAMGSQQGVVGWMLKSGGGSGKRRSLADGGPAR